MLTLDDDDARGFRDEGQPHGCDSGQSKLQRGRRVGWFSGVVGTIFRCFGSMFTWFGGAVRWFGGGKALLLGTARMLPLALVFSAVLWAGA